MQCGYVWVAFLIGGIFLGYIMRLVHERLINTGKYKALENTEALEEVVMFVIVGAWLVSVLVSFVLPDKEVPLAMSLLMGSVVGYLFKKENPVLQGIKKGITIGKDNEKEK